MKKIIFILTLLITLNICFIVYAADSDSVVPTFSGYITIDDKMCPLTFTVSSAEFSDNFTNPYFILFRNNNLFGDKRFTLYCVGFRKSVNEFRTYFNGVYICDKLDGTYITNYSASYIGVEYKLGYSSNIPVILYDGNDISFVMDKLNNNQLDGLDIIKPDVELQYDSSIPNVQAHLEYRWSDGIMSYEQGDKYADDFYNNVTDENSIYASNFVKVVRDDNNDYKLECKIDVYNKCHVRDFWGRYLTHKDKLDGVFNSVYDVGIIENNSIIYNYNTFSQSVDDIKNGSTFGTWYNQYKQFAGDYYFDFYKIVVYLRYANDNVYGDWLSLTLDSSNLTDTVNIGTIGGNKVVIGTTSNDYYDGGASFEDIIGGNIAPSDSTITNGYSNIQTNFSSIDTDTAIGYIKNGFGLLGDNGLIMFTQNLFSFIPQPIWVLIYSCFGAIVVVAIIKLIRGM